MTSFAKDDRIRHNRRPEWGLGVIHSATPILHEGVPAQRLIVKFDGQPSRVTLNTAVAEIAPADRQEKTMTMTTTNTSKSGDGWLSQLEAAASGKQQHELWDLPDALNDPFSSYAQRILATLDTCRYSTEPRSLIDWAVAQTGLTDPLSKYTRPELEQAFPRFARDRDKHLRDLIFQAKRQEPGALQEVRKQIRHPKAQSAFDKLARR